MNYFTDQDRWADQVFTQYRQERNASNILITDLDDTLLDANARWFELYMTLLESQESKTPPTDIATFKKDGPRVHIEPLVADYQLLKERLIEDVSFNTGFSAFSNAKDLQEAGAIHAIPHGYISTRPALLHEVTSKNLQDCGFTDSPLLLRSASVAYADTISYKNSALFALRALLDAAHLKKVNVYYVDDYQGLIERLNHSRQGIIGIHFDENSSWESILGAIGLSSNT